MASPTGIRFQRVPNEVLRKWLLAAAILLGAVGCTPPDKDTVLDVLAEVGARLSGTNSKAPIDSISSVVTIDQTGTATGCDQISGSTASTKRSTTIELGPFTPTGFVVETIDGKSVNANKRKFEVSDTATACWKLPGAAKQANGTVIVELPISVWVGGFSRQDPAIPVAATYTFPASTKIDAKNVRIIRDVSSTVRVVGTGTSPVLTVNAELVAWSVNVISATIEPGTINGSGPPGFETAEMWLTRMTAQEKGDEGIADADRSVAMQQALGAGILLAVPLLLGLVMWRMHRRQYSTARRKARGEQGVPQRIEEPPAPMDPAVVALLVDQGRQVSARGLAGSLVWAAHNDRIRFEETGGRRFVARVRQGTPQPGARGRDANLVAAPLVDLIARRAAAAGGHLTGPPLWSDQRDGELTDAVAAAAKLARTATRDRKWTQPLKVIPWVYTWLVVSLMMIYPLVVGPADIDRPWLMPAVMLSLTVALWIMQLALAHFVEPKRLILTVEGFRQRALWLAYRKHLADLDVRDVGAGGVVVWGAALAYGSALGLAPALVGDIAPPGLSELDLTDDLATAAWSARLDAESTAAYPGDSGT